MNKLDFMEHHKRIQDEDETSWAVSFSDMMTLLLCFFVMLVGISKIDVLKVEMMSQTFSESKRITMKELVDMIQSFINARNIQQEVSVKLTTKGVEISFKDKLLYDLGKADLKAGAMPILSEISKLLNYKEIADRKILVEGHTDSLPISSRVYPSNWELSSARASSVVRYFIEQKLDSRRFESIGYADTRPIRTDVDKSVGQPENRRVVVVISPEHYLEKGARKEIDVSSMGSSSAAVERIIEEGKETTPAPAQNMVSQAASRKPTDAQLAANKISEPAAELSGTEKLSGATEIEKDDKTKMREYFVDGQTHFKNKDFKKAIESWEKVLAIDPNHELSKRNIERARSGLKKSE